MATETDVDALDYYWRKWRDTTGKTIKEHFVAYVELMNKAAAGNSEFLCCNLIVYFLYLGFIRDECCKSKATQKP